MAPPTEDQYPYQSYFSLDYGTLSLLSGTIWASSPTLSISLPPPLPSPHFLYPSFLLSPLLFPFLSLALFSRLTFRDRCATERAFSLFPNDRPTGNFTNAITCGVSKTLGMEIRPARRFIEWIEFTIAVQTIRLVCVDIVYWIEIFVGNCHKKNCTMNWIVFTVYMQHIKYLLR